MLFKPPSPPSAAPAPAGELIKQTPLPSGSRLVTVKRTDNPYSLRPFVTFTVDDSGSASTVADFQTLAAALHHHQWFATKPRGCP